MVKSNKPIARKNYFAFISLVAITIFSVISITGWYKNYKYEENRVSILDGVISELVFEEFDTYLIDNKDAVIYITKSGDEKNRGFSERLDKVVTEYNLETKIVYINVEELEGYEEKIEEKFTNSVIPTVLVFKDNELVASMDIKAKNYSKDMLIAFLMEQGVIEE